MATIHIGKSFLTSWAFCFSSVIGNRRNRTVTCLYIYIRFIQSV
jgi:hypothetical protein